MEETFWLVCYETKCSIEAGSKLYEAGGDGVFRLKNQSFLPGHVKKIIKDSIYKNTKNDLRGVEVQIIIRNFVKIDEDSFLDYSNKLESSFEISCIMSLFEITQPTTLQITLS